MTELTPRTGSNSVFVLDGGFSTQLAKHVGTTADGDPLWSARFLQTHPNDVLKTHLDFLSAGSDIISTNTYQASVTGFVKHLGVTPKEGYALIQSAVSLAKKARDIYLETFKEKGVEPLPNPNPLIAGSVGAYGAFLNDGSEYRGDYADKTSEQIMREWHKSRIEALIEAGVELLAIETIPCQKEAKLLVELLKDYPDTKAWLSFSCKDDKSLVHGEDFKTVANKCYDMNPEQLIAVGANCCSPLLIENLFKSVNEGRSNPIPLITYPNSGEKYTSEKGWETIDKYLELHTFVPRWLDLGVKYVGGCCRTGSSDIALIRRQVDSWQKKKSDKH